MRFKARFKAFSSLITSDIATPNATKAAIAVNVMIPAKATTPLPSKSNAFKAKLPSPAVAIILARKISSSRLAPVICIAKLVTDLPAPAIAPTNAEPIATPTSLTLTTIDLVASISILPMSAPATPAKAN